jgi:hypothetical protein
MKDEAQISDLRNDGNVSETVTMEIERTMSFGKDDDG